MSHCKVVLFGEAERGEYQEPRLCQTVSQLVESFGNPPPGSQGIHYAVQVLLFHQELIFLRVHEEGFHSQDYFRGVDLLHQKNLISGVSAICIPGVGDSEIINWICSVCKMHHSIMMTTEPDLYDYLTSRLGD